MYLFELKPAVNSKYHFGEGSLEKTSDIFHSHSLFSAIVNNYIKLYGENEEEIQELKNIKLSSLFYKYNDILLIPKPEHPNLMDIDFDKYTNIKPKDIKKIKFMSIKFYKEIIYNNRWEEFLKEIDYKLKDSKNRKFPSILVTEEEKEEKEKKEDIFKEIKLYDTFIEHKIAMDRIKNITLQKDGKGQLYSVEFLKLNKNVSFYFLVDLSALDNTLKNKVIAAIRLIEDEGLGGERSSGAGFFKKVKKENIKDFKDILKEDSDYYMTLGIGIPKKEHVDKIEYYKLFEIGGYIYSFSLLAKRTENIWKSSTEEINEKLLKKRILAIKEGSIVKKGFEGEVRDIAPSEFKQHNVYAHGNPILLPFRWG